MRAIPWSLSAILVATALQAQPRASLPDPVAYPESRWASLGRLDDDDLAADREALASADGERGVWVRLRGVEHRGSTEGLFMYDYYTIDCEGRRFRHHMRLYVFNRIVHNSTGMTAEWETIQPGGVAERLCRKGPGGATG